MKLVYVRRAPGKKERPPRLDYPATWLAFWKRWRGAHSMLRCPGGPCPGGCGAGAKDDLKQIVEASRG